MKIDGDKYISGYWGKKPLYRAKVGTGPEVLILIRGIRKFEVGQRIKFVKRSDVEGMCIGTTPQWRGGLIDEINEQCLFVELF